MKLVGPVIELAALIGIGIYMRSVVLPILLFILLVGYATEHKHLNHR